MKKQTDEEKFISVLLADDGELSRRTLAHGLAAMRQKRARRSAWRAACFLALLGVLTALLVFEHFRGADRQQMSTFQVSKQSPLKPEVIAGTSIRVLSDVELLEFFKGRPVALV